MTFHPVSWFGLAVGVLGWPVLVIYEFWQAVTITDAQAMWWALSCFVLMQIGGLLLAVRHRHFQLSALLKTGVLWPLAAVVGGQLLGAILLLIFDAI